MKRNLILISIVVFSHFKANICSWYEIWKTQKHVMKKEKSFTISAEIHPLLRSLSNLLSKSFFHVYIFSSLLDLNVHILLYTAFLPHYDNVLVYPSH